MSHSREEHNARIIRLVLELRHQKTNIMSLLPTFARLIFRGESARCVFVPSLDSTKLLTSLFSGKCTKYRCNRFLQRHGFHDSRDWVGEASIHPQTRPQAPIAAAVADEYDAIMHDSVEMMMPTSIGAASVIDQHFDDVTDCNEEEGGVDGDRCRDFWVTTMTAASAVASVHRYEYDYDESNLHMSPLKATRLDYENLSGLDMVGEDEVAGVGEQQQEELQEAGHSGYREAGIETGGPDSNHF